MPLPANLAKFVPAEAAKPTAPVAPPTPSPEGGIGSWLSGVGSGIERFFGGIFGNQKAPAPASTKGGIPENLQQFIPEDSGESAPTAPPAKKASIAPPAAPAAKVDLAGIPENLHPFINADTPADTQKKSTDTSPFGDLFKPTSDEFATSGSTPQTTTESNPLVDLLQGLPRDAATIGISAGQAVANIVSKKAGEALDISADPAKMGPLGTILLGHQPIEGLADTAAKYESTIKNSDFAKKTGLSKYATALGVLGSVGPISLDFLGIGGETSAIEALARARTAEEAAGVLRQIGVHDDIIHSAAEKFAAMTDKGEIKSGLDSIDALQKATKVIPPQDTASTIHDVRGGSDMLTGDAEIPKEEMPSDGGFGSQESDLAAKEGMAPASALEKPGTVRSVDKVEEELAHMTEQKAWLEDALGDHPGKQLMKYRSNETGELPEIKGRTGKQQFGAKGQPLKDKRGKFNTSGDTIIQEIMGQDASGGGDIDMANESLSSYQELKDQVDQTNARIRELRAERNVSLQSEQNAERAGKEAAKQEKTQRLAREPKPSKAEKMEASPGGRLRRGAEVVRKNNKPVPATMARGQSGEDYQRAAIGETTHGHIDSGPFKGFSTRMKNWFQDWVFSRQAVPEEVKVALKPYEVLKKAKLDEWGFEFLGKGIKEGKDGARYVVEGPRSRYGMFGKVENILGRWLDEENAAGIRVAEKDNYLPIYLKDKVTTEDELLAGRHLGLRPGFSMQSQFKDYVEAMEAGYAPKYDNIYDIMKARATAHYKAMADAKFFRTGVEKGWVIPKDGVAPDMRGKFRDLNSERFPTQGTAYGNQIYRNVYTAPEKLAEKINNYLYQPSGKLDNFARVGRSMKNAALSVGIPYTGVSIHFWNVLPREVALDFALSPLRAPLDAAKYAYYAINSRAAGRYIEKHIEEAMPLIRAGMKISTEEHDPFAKLAAAFEKDDKGIYKETLATRSSKVAKSMSDWLHHVFGGNTFDKLLPARKIENGMRLMASYQKAGYTADEAARATAEDINAVYGGINWESLGRNRTFQSVLQGTLFAPDFAETNLRLGTRIAKAFANPKSVQGRIYRGMMYFYVGSYVASNIINYENTGHWMPENDIVHQFSIDLGPDTNGKERYFNLYGTGVDFMRLPLYAATAIAKGNYKDLQSIIENRLSIPLKAGAAIAFNVDWKGDPILGPDNFNRPQSAGTQAANLIGATVGQAVPGSIGNFGSLVAGQLTPLNAAEQALGLPITEKNTTPTTANINALKAQAATDIGSGNYTLFNKLVKAGVISSRSRATFIRDALTGAKTARQQRAAARAKAKLQQEKANLKQEGFTAQ